MTTPVSDRLARIAALEEQRSRLAAEQATEVALLAAERRALIEADIVAGPKPGVGSARRLEHAERQLKAEVGKARRMSPAQAGRYLTWACEAPVETPRTFALLAAGAVSERRAMTVAQVSAPLDSEQRRQVDAEIAGQMLTWGDQKVDTETRAAVYRVDPAGACERAAYAANQRRVSFRPAPETMGWLTALLPMVQLVACRAALENAVKNAKAAGDERGRGHVMADTLVERITGQTTAAEVPIAIQLLITDRTLLGGSDEPGRFADGTPIPAPMARDLILDTQAVLRVKRLFTDPMGRVVTAETNSRDFTPAMAAVIRWRDGGTCTTDWCDALIRHIDHDMPHTRGGPTSIANGKGMCIWCNETKSDRIPDPPPPPAAARPPGRPHHRKRRRSRVERLARRRIAATRSRPQLVVEFSADRCTERQ